MCPTRWVATAALLLTAGTGHAQFVRGFVPYKQAVAVQVRTGPFSGFSYFARSYGFGFAPVVSPVWYGGPGFVPLIGNPFPPQPVVIQNIIQAAPAPAAPAGGNAPPPEFEVAAPRPAAKARPAPPPPMPPAPALIPDPPKAVRPPGRADADRLAEAGREAFAGGQYGRALEFFRKAAQITPDEPSSQYLVSQAYFALGKYQEAVAAIAAGMARRRDWPDARFPARALYGARAAEFDEHLGALRQAVDQFPDDANLLFLLGHQLWFDGKPAEAKRLLERARLIDRGQTPAGAFLRT